MKLLSHLYCLVKAFESGLTHIKYHSGGSQIKGEKENESILVPFCALINVAAHFSYLCFMQYAKCLNSFNEIFQNKFTH